MTLLKYDPSMGQTIKTNVTNVGVDRAFLAHFQVPATAATVATINGVHLAFTNTTAPVGASCVVRALSAVTDTLTTTNTTTIGAAGNTLKISLTTGAGDNLVVTKTDATYTINIALANATANKNTVALIQNAIRTLGTVGTVSVSVVAVICLAGGNWDTAAVATREVAPIPFSGGITGLANVLTTGISPLSVPRCLSATTDGTAGDIKAVQVVVEGTNFNDEFMAETLPTFTVDTKTTVQGSKAFKTVTRITIPAHDGNGATTAIGFNEKLGLPYKLSHNTVLKTYKDNILEANASTVTVSATVIESNTIDLDSALNAKIVDVYLIV